MQDCAWTCCLFSCHCVEWTAYCHSLCLTNYETKPPFQLSTHINGNHESTDNIATTRGKAQHKRVYISWDIMCIWYSLPTENKDRQFDNFFIIGGIINCHNDNLQCHQWWKSCHIDDILFSVTSPGSGAVTKTVFVNKICSTSGGLGHFVTDFSRYRLGYYNRKSTEVICQWFLPRKCGYSDKFYSNCNYYNYHLTQYSMCKYNNYH